MTTIRDRAQPQVSPAEANCHSVIYKKRRGIGTNKNSFTGRGSVMLVHAIKITASGLLQFARPASLIHSLSLVRYQLNHMDNTLPLPHKYHI